MTPFSLTYAVLFGAILCEVAGTSALHASQQFTRPLPSALAILLYGVALVGISHTFRRMPMGIVYAIWSGLGIVLVAGIGWMVFGQRLDAPARLGIALIIAGVVIVNAFSKSFGPSPG